MPVAFGVSLVVRGVTMDPAPMLAATAPAREANGIDVLRVGDVVRFTADAIDTLTLLAPPLAAWWQHHEPTEAGDVVLRFVGPYGVSELTYGRPDLAVEGVRRTIEVESGRPYGPGDPPGPLRRLAAALPRRARSLVELAAGMTRKRPPRDG